MAIDTKNKRTVLNEDASIYSSHKETSEKQKWKSMNSKERRIHFKDYYAIPLLASLVIIFIVGYLIYDAVSSYRDQMLMAAIVNDQIDDNTLKSFNEDILNLLGYDSSKQKVNIDDNFLLSGGSNSDAATAAEQITSYIYAKQLDIMIADKASFNHYASLGCFSDLKEMLTPEEYERYSEYLYYPELEITDTNPVPKNEDSVRPKETYPCGILLSKSSRYMALKGAQKEPVLGVIMTSQHRNDVLKVLAYLFS